MTDEPAVFDIPILWGDGEHDDSEVIRLLLNGGAAYSARGAEMMVAPTIYDLPPGIYRTCRLPSLPLQTGPDFRTPGQS